MANKEENKLLKLVKEDDSNMLEYIQWLEKNEKFLDTTARLALKILRALDNLNMTKMDLAVRLNVSKQYVTKMLKGSQNFTISKMMDLEDALNINLIDRDFVKKEARQDTTVVMQFSFSAFEPKNQPKYNPAKQVVKPSIVIN